MRPASLYIHLPFCTRKCPYCHFYVVPDRDSLKDQVLAGLNLEWKLRLPKLQGCQLESIYFGGGTPWLFGPSRLHVLLDQYKQVPWHPNIEITIEANPESIDLKQMQEYATLGVNRISFGVQSFDDPLLKTLGRNHSSADIYRAIDSARHAGINNISIDLMYDLPGQTLQTWRHTLQTAITLPIKHLSLYNLTIEPHTLFHKKQKSLLPLLPKEEISAQMYQIAVQTLTSHGFDQYEISAFAKDDAISHHNSGYWTARPFLGLGPSAFSYMDGIRFRNIAHLSKYTQSLENGQDPIDFTEELDPDARAQELLILQLRLMKGVDLNDFCPQSLETKKSLQELIGSGLLTLTDQNLKLTEKGILFYDTVATALV